jgi:glycosyltransferase involved in cell wall biosynthesis
MELLAVSHAFLRQCHLRPTGFSESRIRGYLAAAFWLRPGDLLCLLPVSGKALPFFRTLAGSGTAISKDGSTHRAAGSMIALGVAPKFRKQERMRILHIAAGNLFGGVETMLLTLARQSGLCPEIAASFAVCFEGTLSSELRRTEAPVHVLGEVRASKPWTIWRARRKLLEILDQHLCDMVICHSAWPHAVFGPVIGKAGVPLLTWLHNPAGGTHWVERWAGRTRPDCVICNSQFTAGTANSLFPNVPIEVVYCPVAETENSTCHRAQVRAELSTSGSAVVVIQVSRWERLKGHLIHLEALGKIRQLSEWVAWFVGGAQRPSEARYLEEVKQRARQLSLTDRIRFLGQRADVPRLLAAADIHCQPNTEPESFGISFVEGLQARLPVVTTAIGGALEILDDSCGILTRPGDAEGLASSLRLLIGRSDLRLRLGRAGPARAKALCNPERQASRLYALCQRVLESRLAA